MVVVVALENAIPAAGMAPAILDAAGGRPLVVAHGSSPHLALMAHEGESDRDVRTYPLDLLADPAPSASQAEIARELRGALGGGPVTSLLTHVVVDILDPAFRHPTFPLGDHVVAVPAPRAVVEAPVIEMLLGRGVTVVVSGGGMPVIVDVDDACHGVEAVVDQYWAAAVLARQIGAELLVVLTTDGDALVPTEAAAWFTTTTGSAAQVMPLGGLNGSRVTARPTPG